MTHVVCAERKGYTGPEHVIDGKEGLAHCFGPEWKLNILTDGLGDSSTKSWRITQCGMKAFPTEALTHTPISAVLALVRDHDLQPNNIARVHIRTTARGTDILSDASKYDPHTKETADHSLPYVVAAAIAERQVTPLQFTPEKIMHPVIREQLKKIVVSADEEIEKVFPALQRVIVRIHMVDGREFMQQLDYPKGDPRNPLTDSELEEKFEALAGPVLSHDACRNAIHAIWHLEKRRSIRELMKLLRADRAGNKG